MARLAVINLDWLDGEIASGIYDFRFRGALDYVRKNCKPIEEPNVNPHFETSENSINSGYIGIKNNAISQSLVLPIGKPKL